MRRPWSPAGAAGARWRTYCSAFSVSLAVATRADCPVIVVRGTDSGGAPMRRKQAAAYRGNSACRSSTDTPSGQRSSRWSGKNSRQKYSAFSVRSSPARQRPHPSWPPLFGNRQNFGRRNASRPRPRVNPPPFGTRSCGARRTCLRSTAGERDSLRRLRRHRPGPRHARCPDRFVGATLQT